MEFPCSLDISVFMLNILTVMDNHTNCSDYFCSDFVGLYFTFLETSFVRELHSYVCRCPVELVLEGNILLCNGVLSFRLTEYLGLEGCAAVTNGRS